MVEQSVLVVDDDRAIVRAACMRLGAAGFNVLTAYDGRAGLALALARRPDAIVLDIRMPVMDGLATLAHLRRQPQTSAIPVVMLSASVAETAKSKALDLGARHFLEKPYTAPDLVRAVRGVLAPKADAGPAIEAGD